MKLPAGEIAIVEMPKLRDYCLNPLHPRGRHKARVFASALGITRGDAEFLGAELLRAARDGEAGKGTVDQFGERYTVDSLSSADTGRPLSGAVGLFARANVFPG